MALLSAVGLSLGIRAALAAVLAEAASLGRARKVAYIELRDPATPLRRLGRPRPPLCRIREAYRQG